MSADYLFQTDKCYDVTFDTGDKARITIELCYIKKSSGKTGPSSKIIEGCLKKFFGQKVAVAIFMLAVFLKLRNRIDFSKCIRENSAISIPTPRSHAAHHILGDSVRPTQRHLQVLASVAFQGRDKYYSTLGP